MRKLISIFGLMLIYISVAYGQAAVDIPLSATNGTTTIQLAVGLDLTATNGIDAALGEADLPPAPPAGNFDIRFDLTPYAGEALSSLKDYRAPGAPAAFPYTGDIQHTLLWQTLFGRFKHYNRL